MKLPESHLKCSHCKAVLSIDVQGLLVSEDGAAVCPVASADLGENVEHKVKETLVWEEHHIRVYFTANLAPGQCPRCLFIHKTACFESHVVMGMN